MAVERVEMHSVVVASDEQVSCELAGEAAILNLKNGSYYGLNTVGATVWDLLKKPISVRELCNALLERYEVEPQRCADDLLALLRDMIEQGLIEVKKVDE
jgi:hypothetical protein